MEKEALHIWPRKDFMLIALPNPDGTFTCTLFLNHQSDNNNSASFSSLKTKKQVTAFFNSNFSDAMRLLKNPIDEFIEKSANPLFLVNVDPWVINNKVALIGDAAHAMVPFYGQGMICGFEDCYVLNSLLEQNADEWTATLCEFEQQRKPDANAIADLALENFVVMRHKVGDESFLLRKQIEAHLNSLYPDKWIPLYSMVTFNENMRYSEALAKGKQQEAIMDGVMASLRSGQDWHALDFNSIIAQL